MMFTADFLLQMVIALAAAGGVYAGIRIDLARLHERATTAQATANKAHSRIDAILSGHK